MTRYEGEQKLRGIERNIRKYKREAETLAAGGVDDTAARIKLGEWQARARDFTKQTGIERDRAREFVGTVSGVQPKPILDDYYEAKRYEKHAAQIFNTESNYLSNVEQGAAMSFDKADNGNVNPRYGTTKGYSENCQSAVVTFEARLNISITWRSRK